MSNAWVLLALASAALLAFALGARRRTAILAIVVLGFAQDPLRKFADGEPVVFSALVLFYVGLLFIVVFGSDRRASIMRPFRGDALLMTSLQVFGLILAVQAAMSLLRYGDPVVAAIGVLSYAAPLPALWLTWRIGLDGRNIRPLLVVYIACSLVLALSIFASVLGLDWALLRQVGPGLVVYDDAVGVLRIHPGLARAPEAASWHLATAACLVIVVYVADRRLGLFWVALPIVGVLVSAGLFTGRRKFIVLILGFAVAYTGMLIASGDRRVAGRMTRVVVVALVAMAFVAPFVLGSGLANPYVVRLNSVFGDLHERMSTVGLSSIEWAINRAGYFGLGAGTGSQGAQHFGGAIAGGAAEGGLGKLVVELGVPGLLAGLLVALAMGRRLWTCVTIASRQEDRATRAFTIGLASIVVANGPMFVSASQIYGDPFVLVILGLFGGIVLSATGRHANGHRVARNTGLAPHPVVASNGRAVA